MRIVFLISSLNSGGAERVATTLCNAWVARHDSVTLVPTFSGGGDHFYALNERVELTYLSSLVPLRAGSGKRYVARLLALRRLIRERKPDVVISFLPNVNIAALAATAFTGVPCIVCERSDPSNRPLGLIWRMACRSLYRFADLVAVQTKAVASSIHKVYGGLRRVAVVPNPLPQDLLQISSCDSPSNQRYTLLSLGRLSKEKQVGQIIESFATLAVKFPLWDLHIYGEGPARDELSARIEALGLQQRILLKGRTSEPWKVMARADAFVMNSRYEGFPNALLEAMGVGLPCVSSDCSSGPSEISANGQYALLFEPGDQVGLAAALAQVMADEGLRARLGRQARESVIERYSLSAVLRIWDEFFSTVRRVPR